jgi:uncharacterized Ntn-hydrolase superfamily protein
MKEIITIIFSFYSIMMLGQDTFSIVAVDPATGEIGSAGATCLDDDDIAGGAVIISDIVVGKGAVNTQSYYLEANQNLANGFLNDGSTASQVLDDVVINDSQNNPSIRQYGAATLIGDDNSRSAAFTGVNCFDVKHHRIGLNFAVQGNILLNEGIVDSMYERFINTNGPLHLKLMSAMQGANVPGADSRCLNEGVSSRSAFLRVAKPGDSNNDLWMDLNVSKTPFGKEPIDSLQNLFDEFILINNDISDQIQEAKIFPNPSDGIFEIVYKFNSGDQIIVYDLAGNVVKKILISKSVEDLSLDINVRGSYTLIGISSSGNKLFNQMVIVDKN